MMKTAPQVLNAIELARGLNAELSAGVFKDYCPNGLQVESGRQIKKIVTGVTASAAFIVAAIAAGADALLVHHGLMWKGEDGSLVGFRYQRVKQLIMHDVALLAYHLPLDAHPVMGNNAQLAARLGLHTCGAVSGEPLLILGQLPAALTVSQFGEHIERSLHRSPQLFGALDKPIKTIGLCTGGAQGLFETAIANGADAYLTGEISEQHVHIARETGVAFIAAGHHATERYGVQAVGAWVAERFGIAHQFIDVDSPV
jgi:dinuclear metal center YbgI/SA1388 family protein